MRKVGITTWILAGLILIVGSYFAHDSHIRDLQVRLAKGETPVGQELREALEVQTDAILRHLWAGFLLLTGSIFLAADWLAGKFRARSEEAP